MRDMLPVAGIAQAPAVFAINSTVPAKTVTEFIAYAKAKPSHINMGSAGIGSTAHLAGELFKLMAGVNLIHVPYRGGGPAINEKVGMERAEAVKRYLYEQHQIPLHKMNVISYGETKPVAPNKTKDGRAQNRRVVIKVLT